PKARWPGGSWRRFERLSPSYDELDESAGLITQIEVMRLEEPGLGGPSGPLATLRQVIHPRRTRRAGPAPAARRRTVPGRGRRPCSFSDQSQLSHHRERLVGLPPVQFRTPARIA